MTSKWFSFPFFDNFAFTSLELDTCLNQWMLISINKNHYIMSITSIQYWKYANWISLMIYTLLPIKDFRLFTFALCAICQGENCFQNSSTAKVKYIHTTNILGSLISWHSLVIWGLCMMIFSSSKMLLYFLF